MHRSSVLPLSLFASLWLAAPTAATPLISELLYDATGSDNGQSFIELSGEPGTLLDGLTLEGINGAGGAITVAIALSGSIPDDGLFLVADVDSDGLTAVPEPDFLANFDFQNGPDSVVLRAGESVLDAVGYGVFGAGDVFAGEGASAADAPAGASLARFFADLDTDDNATDFEVLAMPTPGAAEFVSVPEPRSGLLMASAILTLLAAERRRARPRPGR